MSIRDVVAINTKDSEFCKGNVGLIKNKIELSCVVVRCRGVVVHCRDFM